MKIYVEVDGGMVTGVYTDCNDEIDLILCDLDNAGQESENDGFEFSSTNNCAELNKNRNKLKVLY